MNCKNCKWSVLVVGEEGFCECHRYPPATDGWAMVAGIDWCGEFIQQKIEPLLAYVDTPREEKDSGLREIATQVISFLNSKTGKAFRPTNANLKLVIGRLKEGYTLQDMRTVTARMCRKWGQDERMSQYLRPATLYNATNFSQYIGECVENGN